MKKNILYLLLLCTINTFAQDSLLLSNRWQDYFEDYTKEQYALFENEDFNKKFKYNQKYNCLVVFKDSTKSPIEFRMSFISIESLCDPKVNLEGNDYKKANEWSIPKEQVKYFVFDDVPFVFDNIVRKQYKFELKPNFWSVLIIDGPIRFTKYFSKSTTSSGHVLSLGIGRIQKYEEDIGSDITLLGGFGFKKFATKAFADYPELVAKINAEQDGYAKKDGLRIVTEYNEWIRNANPEAFKKSMMFGSIISGSMADVK